MVGFDCALQQWIWIIGHRKLSSEISNKIEWIMKNFLDINKAITILLCESQNLIDAVVSPCQLVALQEFQRSSGALPVSLCRLIALQETQRSCGAAQDERRSEFTPCRRWEPVRG